MQQHTLAADDWLTAAVVTHVAKVGMKTVDREIKAGRLRAARIGGCRDIRVKRSWISDWLEAAATPQEVRQMGRGKSRKSLELIDAAREILEEIQPASIRAVCYRLFTLDIITSMSMKETNRVSSQLTWARENGVIPWDWIVMPGIERRSWSGRSESGCRTS